jgi:hypothetical protein
VIQTSQTRTVITMMQVVGASNAGFDSTLHRLQGRAMTNAGWTSWLMRSNTAAGKYYRGILSDRGLMPSGSLTALKDALKDILGDGCYYTDGTAEGVLIWIVVLKGAASFEPVFVAGRCSCAAPAPLLCSVFLCVGLCH